MGFGLSSDGLQVLSIGCVSFVKGTNDESRYSYVHLTVDSVLATCCFSLATLVGVRRKLNCILATVLSLCLLRTSTAWFLTEIRSPRLRDSLFSFSYSIQGMGVRCGLANKTPVLHPSGLLEIYFSCKIK